MVSPPVFLDRFSSLLERGEALLARVMMEVDLSEEEEERVLKVEGCWWRQKSLGWVWVLWLQKLQLLPIHRAMIWPGFGVSLSQMGDWFWVRRRDC